MLVPYFAGERTPNLPDATASLLGMTLGSTTRENLARAAVEGLLCALADGLAAVEAQGVVAERLLLIGGAALNPAVQAVAAQVFAEPVVVPEPGRVRRVRRRGAGGLGAHRHAPAVAGAGRGLPRPGPPPGDPRGVPRSGGPRLLTRF